MKIKDLKPGMNNVSVKGKIKELKEPRQVTTRYGTEISLTEAILEDETGTISLNLWGEQSEGISEGANVEIANGFVKQFRDQVQLGIGRNGSIKAV